MNFVATFYTHLAALRTARSLEAAGVAATLAPVPRVLSSSCGTCLRAEYDGAAEELITQDAEGVYQVEKDGYRLLAGDG